MDYEEILKNSYKYKLYDKLNEECDDVRKYSSYCTTMQYLESSYKDILEVCYKFARNLIKLHEILSKEKHEEHCRYLNFWITDHVRKKFDTHWEDESKIPYILTGFLTAEHIIKSTSNNTNCHFDYRSNVSLKLWKEWKDLHDYIINYDHINEKITSGGDICTTYSKYFDYIKGLYDKFKGECCEKSTFTCPYKIKLYDWCSKDSLFTKKECDENKGVSEDSPEMTENSDAGDQNIKDVRNLVLSSEPHTYDDSSGGLLSDSSNYYVKLSSGLSLLGICSAFFYLYNFTTFGKLIRFKVLRKEKINIDLEENEQNLIEHTSDNLGANIYDNDFHINYQSS
ncbi:PIR Superfamily Protein [Plasmodium ovale wallikeri]|uniref:PIR Superfamily Protein n=1 Tax=Plasmodium ovale wallikeri TaxID=864142 RepID=A0A1A9AHK6_PLAOA|nr:PIR Superfamily Protein [Plasmodium ovale wallikeri]SBT57758.1 PIR Superfamily Protein [Plasmodium ovale wallikeri]